MPSIYHINDFEPKRRAWESQKTKFAIDNLHDRKLVREAQNKFRTRNWTTAFDNISNISDGGAVVVKWEDGITQSGDYKIQRQQLIGSGQFSEVFRASTPEEKDSVCKVIRAQEFAIRFKIKSMNRHGKILDKISHPRIINLHKIFVAVTTKKWYMFVQFAPGGTIETRIKRDGKPLPENLVRRWMRDVAEGLSYLHFLGIAHRSVQPSSVMLFDDDKPAKINLPAAAFEIGDFATKEPRRCVGIRNPDSYHPPEAIFGPSFDPFPADVWAFGCTTYFALTGRQAFTRVTDKELMRTQLNNKNWIQTGISDNGPRLSDGSKLFLAEIIHGAIDRRPSISEILELPWFTHTSR